LRTAALDRCEAGWWVALRALDFCEVVLVEDGEVRSAGEDAANVPSREPDRVGVGWARLSLAARKRAAGIQMEMLVGEQNRTASRYCWIRR